MVFDTDRQATPTKSQKRNAHATARMQPSKRQAKQTQRLGKTSQKQWSRLRPDVRHQKAKKKPSKPTKQKSPKRAFSVSGFV